MSSSIDTTQSPSHQGRVFVLITAYTAFFSWFSITKHQVWKSTIYDLGLFDQILWNTAHGKILWSSVKNFSYLGDHFSPILLLIAPLYWVVADVRALLVLQSFLLALPALPLYWIARRYTRHSHLPWLIALAYLLYPSVGYTNSFDFHPIALVAAPLVFGFYFMEIKAYKSMLCCLVLALLVKEEVAITVAMYGVFLMLVQRQWRWGLAICALSTSYFLLVMKVGIPAFQPGTHNDQFLYIERYGHLGQDMLSIVKRLLLSPFESFQLSWNAHKSKNLFFFAVPVLCLPLLAPRSLLLWLPSVSYTFLSMRMAQTDIRYQYAAIFMGLLWIAVAEASGNLESLLAKIASPRTAARAGTLLAIGLLCGAVYSVSIPIRYPSLPKPLTPSPDYDAKAFAEVKVMIPPNASLSTINQLGPHFSQRRVLRFSFVFPEDRRYWTGLRRSPYSPTDYHLLHTRDRRANQNFHARVHYLRCKMGYQIKYNRGGFLLLKRDPQRNQADQQWLKQKRMRFTQGNTAQKVALLKEAALRYSDIVIGLLFDGIYDKAPEVRQQAAKAMGQLGQWLTLHALQQAAESDNNADVRDQARRAIGEIRSKMHHVHFLHPCPQPVSRPSAEFRQSTRPKP